MLASLIAVSVFVFGVLQPRKVRVQADGREIQVATNITSNTAVLHRAGVQLNTGDRVTKLTSGSGEVLRVDRARAVRLDADGVTYELHTHAVNIDQLLAEADIVVSGRDSVLQNGALVSINAPVDPPRLFVSRDAGATEQDPASLAIEVRRAVPYMIVDDGHEVPSTSSRPTVAQALREAGIVIGPGDAISPGLQDALAADARVEIRHARAVTVAMPDDHRVLYTLATTVGAALDDAGIMLPPGSFVDPSADTAITAGMSVRVAQLSASSDVEREYVESHTIYKSDASLPPGEVHTIKGHDGARVRRYDVAYVDGDEAGRTLVDEYYDPEPLDTVVYYPTQTGANESGPSAGSGTVEKTLRVYASWYDPASSGRSPDDPAYGITATGKLVTYGIVAVDPTVIPLGTRMFIPGYGYALAADTGGAVKGYIIDLGYPDGVAVDWQPKWLDIYILS